MFTYEVREIDGWNSPDGWYWNTSYFIGEFDTKCSDTNKTKRAFIRFLNSKGIYFKLNRTIIIDNNDWFEIQDRKTKEPLYAAIYRY